MAGGGVIADETGDRVCAVAEQTSPLAAVQADVAQLSLSVEQSSIFALPAALEVPGGNTDADRQKYAENLFKEAERGDGDAFLKLGICYLHGIGLKQDAKEATECFKCASHCADDTLQKNKRLYAEAEILCGICCLRGCGVDKDFIKARKHFRDACGCGVPRAEYLMGVCYAEGIGIGKNLSSAADWYYIAAHYGSAEAKAALEKINRDEHIYSLWQEASLPKDVLARAERGEAEAQLQIGDFYARRSCYLLGNEKEYSSLARDYYKRAAEQGNMQAMCRLMPFFSDSDFNPVKELRDRYLPLLLKSDSADILNSLGSYFFATTMDKNIGRAESFKKQAAEKGCADAQYSLGNKYEVRSWTVDKYLSEAVYWYHQAAKQGNLKAAISLDLCEADEYSDLGETKDTALITECYRRAAEQGDTQGQYLYGLCYANGNGVVKDAALAEQWFAKAAKQSYVDAECLALLRQAAAGDLQAQCKIGIHLYDKSGIDFNGSGLCYTHLSKMWLHPAAEAGNAEAQYYLARCYNLAVPAELNIGRILKWDARSAKQGYADAQIALYYRLNTVFASEQITINRIAKKIGLIADDSMGDVALAWLVRAADSGSARARYILAGRCADESKAAVLYGQAAAQGDKEALLAWGRCYEEGKGVEKDLAKAAEIYGIAAAKGEHDAQIALGNMYYSGLGVERDYSRAVYWYRQAVKDIYSAINHNLEAAANLRDAYINGKGVEKDLEQAEYWASVVSYLDGSSLD
ncbi:sel1 repeat family protein [bacterium]|nr:sel1 repeat family protein [bacterium]